MNTEQLECFLSLASNLNYARTAAEMRISQPAVTRQIQSLERELGVRLFRRSTRQVSLTDAGRAFLPDARSIVTTAHRAVHRFEGEEAGHLVSFVIGCPRLAFMMLLIPVLGKMKEKYPAVHPEIMRLPLTQALPKIDDESIRLAIGSKVRRESDRSCSWRELLRCPLVQVTAAPGMGGTDPGSADTVPVTLEELRRRPTIIYYSPDAPAAAQKLQERVTEGRPASEIYFCESPETAVMMAASGLGDAVLPEIYAAGFRQVVTRPLENSPKLPFGAYYKKGHSDRMTMDFLRLLEESAAEFLQVRSATCLS